MIFLKAQIIIIYYLLILTLNIGLEKFDDRVTQNK